MLDPVENSVENIKIADQCAADGVGVQRVADAVAVLGREHVEARRRPAQLGRRPEGRALVRGAHARDAETARVLHPGGNKFGNVLSDSRRARARSRTTTRRPTSSSYVDTCFSADHNMFDANNNIYFGMNGDVGWVDMDTWDKTHDAEASQGWCPAVLDTNGDGKITPGWTEPNEPVDPTKDHRIDFGCYAVAVNPKDGSLWCSGIGRGDETSDAPRAGNEPADELQRGVLRAAARSDRSKCSARAASKSITRACAWQNWRASGHFSAFDRSKCKSTTDPQATGQSCPEGWTFYRKNDPTYDGSPYHANESYLTHMDVHDALGLGKDAPIYGSVNTDAFEVLQPSTKQFVTLRVPYPLGSSRVRRTVASTTRAGWKGKGLWTSYSSYATWHIEGGRRGRTGMLPKAVKFQIRPNPLAK